MKLPENKSLANGQFFFRAIIRVTLVEPRAATADEEGGSPAVGYLQAFVLMAESHAKAVAFLDEVLRSPRYEAEHPQGWLEQVELMVLEEHDLEESLLELAKKAEPGVLFRSNASLLTAAEVQSGDIAAASDEE